MLFPGLLQSMWRWCRAHDNKMITLTLARHLGTLKLVNNTSLLLTSGHKTAGFCIQLCNSRACVRLARKIQARD